MMVDAQKDDGSIVKNYIQPQCKLYGLPCSYIIHNYTTKHLHSTKTSKYFGQWTGVSNNSRGVMMQATNTPKKKKSRLSQVVIL